MDIKDIVEELRLLRTDNRTEHGEIKSQLQQITDGLHKAELEIGQRPTFDQTRQIAKDRRNGLFGFLGGMVGGFLAWITTGVLGGNHK